MVIIIIWHKLLPVKSRALIGWDALIVVGSNFPTIDQSSDYQFLKIVFPSFVGKSILLARVTQLSEPVRVGGLVFPM